MYRIIFATRKRFIRTRLSTHTMSEGWEKRMENLEKANFIKNKKRFMFKITIVRVWKI